MPDSVVRLKLDWQGVLYLEGEGRVEPGGFAEFIIYMKDNSYGALLYREGYGGPESEAQSDTIRKLKTAGVRLVDPLLAPPEYGLMDSFEMERAPNLSRLSALQGGDLFRSQPGEYGGISTQPVAKGGTGALKLLAILVSCHRIVEEGQNQPERAFQLSDMASPGLHLRFSFGPKSVFRSRYDLTSLPPRLLRFISACDALVAWPDTTTQLPGR